MATIKKILIVQTEGNRKVKPDDKHYNLDVIPGFPEDENEQRLVYFTLPMALNYQRDSHSL